MTTTIHNIIVGKLWIDQVSVAHICILCISTDNFQILQEVKSRFVSVYLYYRNILMFCTIYCGSVVLTSS